MIREEKHWGSCRLFYLTPLNFIGLNLMETMSMDMCKEIGSGMPGAVVSLASMCINIKWMLNNSE